MLEHFLKKKIIYIFFFKTGKTWHKDFKKIISDLFTLVKTPMTPLPPPYYWDQQDLI